MNGDNLSNVRRESSRYIKKKKKEYLKNKINEHGTNSKNSKTKNIGDLCTGINGFKRGYQPRNNVAMDQNGDLFAHSNNT
jgi:hypothetical protein